jgi:hypothetical protein
MLKHIDIETMVEELCNKKEGNENVSGKDHNEEGRFNEVFKNLGARIIIAHINIEQLSTMCPTKLLLAQVVEQGTFL